MYMLTIHPQVNFAEQNVHLHAHDPAMTSLVETTAELHLARTEELVEVLRVREGIASQRAQDANDVQRA